MIEATEDINVDSIMENVHVVKHKNRLGWSITIEGIGDYGILYPFKYFAVRAARQLAQEAEVELFIHDRKGRIQSKDSYGHDPRNVPG